MTERKKKENEILMTKASFNARRGSDGINIASGIVGESLEDETISASKDSYDAGFLLDSIEKAKEKTTRCSTIIETMPFIFWGMWVDLPLRLKWLRLRDGVNDSKNFVCLCEKINIPKSLAFYLISSFNSISILLCVFAYNSFELNGMWQYVCFLFLVYFFFIFGSVLFLYVTT